MLLPFVAGSLKSLLGRGQLVFPQRNLVLGFEHLLAAAAAEQLADDAAAVGSIEYRKIGFVVGVRRFFAQHAHAQRVEGGNRQAAGLAFAEHGADALLHFLGGFVGEGDGGDVVRGVAHFADEVGDFFGDDAGFAAACAGQHKQRPAQIAHRFQLALVQFHGVGRFQAA